MSFGTVAAANGVVSIGFGAIAFLVPAGLAAIYGIALTEREAFVVRLLGASYVAFGILCWAIRGSTDPAARRAYGAAGLVGWSLTLPVVAVGLIAGLANALGWSIVAMQLVFALAWGSLLLRERMVP